MERRRNERRPDGPGAIGGGGKPRLGGLLRAGLLISSLSAAVTVFAAAAIHSARPPNIVFILADDLGYGEPGFQNPGSLHRTPNLDRLAAEGMRLTQHYAGSAVCAPSRCTLMTGLHTGHGRIRDNLAVGPDGAELRPYLQPGDITVAALLQSAGYVTACIGKWGLGDEGTPGVPWQQGFDHFFGYLHNTHGTRYYTEFIYRNAEKQALRGNYGRWRKQYGPDLLLAEALDFLQANRERSFFLYYPFNLVHGDYVDPPPVPNEEEPELPPGLELTPKERTYLAMVRRLDRDVGRLIARIDELGLAGRTLVIFSSDNGNRGLGEKNEARFDASGGLRGGKADLYEGGIRVPMVARWPGVIEAGSTSGHVSAFWDFLPTACELAGVPRPANVDGISYLPTLLGRSQAAHPYLYWELAKRDEPWIVPRQAVRADTWKLVRNGEAPPELYDLGDDPGESRDLAGGRPEIVGQLVHLLNTARTNHPLFPLTAGAGFD
jgi:arylsulfatase A